MSTTYKPGYACQNLLQEKEHSEHPMSSLILIAIFSREFVRFTGPSLAPALSVLKRIPLMKIAIFFSFF